MSLEKAHNRSVEQALNDKKVRGVVLQITMLLIVLFGFYWLINNTLTNLDAQGNSLGFNFLSSTVGFQISQTFGPWLFDYEVGKSTYWEVYFIGIANTFLVAILGIVAATVLGFTMGVMRLSSNIVFKSFATTYIELLRNIPLLLQLFFGISLFCEQCRGKERSLKSSPGLPV